MCARAATNYSSFSSDDDERRTPVSMCALSAGDLHEVLAQARLGDGEAFGQIYRRFARTVHGIVLARVGPQEAEDVTQDVFVAVHGGLASIRDDNSLPGWICTIARNLAMDHSRKQTRRPTTLRLVDDPTHRDAGDDRELADRVLTLIKGLPEAYRETLILRLVEEMTGPEIAAHTGMTHGSVRVNLNRGMSMLRPLLRKEGWQ
ncbi:MAG: RNA polymerase sigma factor [Planctomycetota bacterium]|jgi:RNA polymerase sigma-70 factor (ECF subfamily)